MKKRILVFSILFLIFILPLVFAENESATLTDSQKVDQSYTCLKDKISEKGCSNLGFEEKVFAVMSIGKCKSELVSEGKNDECWPSKSCTLKETAQAILALNEAGKSTTEAEEWLLDQKMSPSELTWYLQIESPEETNCKISYDNKDYNIVINKEKQISVGAGSCLALSEGQWWLRVAPSCYGKEFEISCDKRFLTNLLFKKQDSSTIHVSEITTESSADGVNKEMVESFCFGQGGKCDYEGSLWAAMALEKTDNSIYSYLPYLITLSEDSANSKYIPEMFLYYLTDSYDFRNALLYKQKANKYWDESGDRYYDTALALLSIQDEPTEKTNSKAWLLDDKMRDSEGCWKGSISTTAFILYSLWPRTHASDSGSGEIVVTTCESKSGFCLSSIACREAEGTELNYYCPGISVCCNKNKAEESCSLKGGVICSSDKKCSGLSVDSAELVFGETCCVQGECIISVTESECVTAGGTCKLSCSDTELETSHSCDSYYNNDVCCMTPEETSRGTLWIWILIFGILILLVIIAFLFRDKLRAHWIAFRGKGKPSSGPRGGPSLPPSRPFFPQRGIPPRRVIPSSTAPVRRASSPRPSGEMEEVLKKLKAMGK